MTVQEQLFEEARAFVVTCHAELEKRAEETAQRLAEIRAAIGRSGTYEHTFEELEHGSRMAWRNSNRCIGRLFWNGLKVFDARDETSEEAIAQAIFRHLDFATNGGKIRPCITVFKAETNAPKVRIWNHQLIRYAGYETEHGTLGDPSSIAFTATCHSLGWHGQGTHFDVLPLVIQVQDRAPQVVPIPAELVLEVPLRHPDFEWFADLNARWYAVPIISDMALEIGGIHYAAAPFNGWYMETEIGARNLADAQRYNLLPKLAALMGLDTSNHSTLWQDRALVELNVAVLHSFKLAGVTMVDHHTAAEQFKRFEQQEMDRGRDLTGNWTWLIPPVSPATTHIFHEHYDNAVVKPNYFHQACPY